MKGVTRKLIVKHVVQFALFFPNTIVGKLRSVPGSPNSLKQLIYNLLRATCVIIEVIPDSR